jgi:hypothetical protein
MDVVQATVDRSELLTWDGKQEECWLVVYRNDSGSGSPESQTPRGKLWVRHDGTVLKQQMLFFDSLINFERLSDKDATRLADAAGQKWWSVDEEDIRNETPRFEGLPRYQSPFAIPTARREYHPRKKVHD